MAEINTAEQLEREIAYVATCLTSTTSADRLRRAHASPASTRWATRFTVQRRVTFGSIMNPTR